VAVGEVLPGVGGRRLAETTILDGVDYCYVSVKGSVDPEPRILQIRTRRAALVVDTPSAQAAVAVASAETARPVQVREYALQTQQRLDATILGKVRVKDAGRDNYEISAADLRMAMNHGEQVLMEAWSTVRPMLSWDQGINFQVKSPIADGVLGPRGFRVTSPKLAERAGLEMGDVVLAVNDQPINGFGDVFRLYRQVKADQRVSMVALKLERQGQLMTKTYRIR
jgi:membrane-associated protease RseP (regulator of RpoE activity)